MLKLEEFEVNFLSDFELLSKIRRIFGALKHETFENA